MGKQRTTLILLLILFLLLVSVTELRIVNAEPKTIVVPDQFSTIQKAIDNAGEGDTIFVKKGTYKGPTKQTLVIRKTISIIGEDAENTILQLNPSYVEPNTPFTLPYYENAVTIEANDVILSSLTIKSFGGSLFIAGLRTELSGNIIATSLFLKSGSYTKILNNIITAVTWCTGSRCTITENEILGGGIVVSGGSSNKIYNNTIMDCNTETAGYGIRLDAGNGNIVYNNTIKNCNRAVAILGTCSSNNVYANIVTNNIGGLVLHGQGSDNVFHNNYVANNQYGVLLSYTYMMSPGENNTVYQNNFVDNVEQISTSPTYPGTTSPTYPTGRYDNGTIGNYWSDYNGTDNDGDGIGDTPYIVDEYNKDNFPLMEPAIIPEFPSWTILPLVLTVTLFSIIVKRKLCKAKAS